VTFTRSFVIGGFAQELPAGVYVIETEEELVHGLSFPVYRRVSTTLRVDRIPGRPGQTLRGDSPTKAFLIGRVGRGGVAF